MSDKILQAKIKNMGYSVFEKKSEEPNWYEIEDGAILKVFPVLNSIILDKGRSPKGASVNAQNIVTVYVPKKLIGQPSQKLYSAEELNAKLDKEDMKFKVIAEHFNEYVVDNNWLLSVKTTLSQVNRSKLRGGMGEPHYTINSSPVVKLKQKRK